MDHHDNRRRESLKAKTKSNLYYYTITLGYVGVYNWTDKELANV